MIDTEQMRKSVSELLYHSSSWEIRDKHENTGLKRLPGLINRIINCANPEIKTFTNTRLTKQYLDDADIYTQFHLLGRETTNPYGATHAVETFLSRLDDQGLIE
jgi:hypothetical protein